MNDLNSYYFIKEICNSNCSRKEVNASYFINPKEIRILLNLKHSFVLHKLGYVINFNRQSKIKENYKTMSLIIKLRILIK